MIRLNVDLRGRICRAIVRHKIDPKTAELEKMGHAICADYIALALGGLADKFHSLPESWFISRQWLTFAGATFVSIPMPERALPAFLGNTQSIDRDHPLAARIFAYEKLRVSIRDEENELHRDVMATLSAFTTVGALLKGWPEVEPFIPDSQAPMKLPAVRTEDLNKRLDLPVVDAS